MAGLDGVELIINDVPVEFDEPVEIKNAPALATATSTALNLLNVPSLWRKGYTGHGRLVCSFDTGVESTHPALASKWRGNHADLSACWFSPIDPTVAPFDKVGHGTHTMGIMLGSTATDTFGVAPDAEWITAGVIDQGRDLNTTISDIINAFQWALDPDDDTSTTDDVPDVISNSWGVPAGILPDCNETFWQMIDNVEAAGIVTIFACGNEGPDAGTIRNPADRASTPLNSFSVGAVDDDKVIAGFSSRGPSSCNGAIKPEIVAPGVAIYSSTKGGIYKYMSGTSMAAPFISGLVALCRQYNPDATVEQIKNAFILSAEDLGNLGEDNNYGYGLVDASRLLDYLPVPKSTYFFISEYEIFDNDTAVPGESFNLQLTVVNPSANVDQINGRLVSDDNRVDIVIDQGSFFFGSGTTATNHNLFSLTLDNDIVNGDSILLELVLEDAEIFVYDTLSFYLPVGYAAPGLFSAHRTSRVDFTVSDFAQYGLAEGSIYNLAAEGFRFENGDNLLYEAGMIIGRNNLQLSSSIRDAEADFVPSDFTPETSLQSEYIDGGNGLKYEARMVDTYSEIQIPVTVSQVSVNYFNPADDNFVIMKYRLINSSLEKLTGLCFGFMADFDLTGGLEAVSLDENYGLLYQYNAAGTIVGLLALSDGIS
ncbi:MAG: S8 family serine peptidase, partial [Candidatus Zixiibacteriota bacterium]